MVAVLAEALDSAEICEFLQKNEHFCVSLCSYVRRNEKNILVFMEGEKIWGVIHVDSGITHCLPFYKKENPVFEECLLVALGNLGFGKKIPAKKISCVDGEKTVTNLLVKLFIKSGFKIFCQNEYFLLTKEDDLNLPPPASLLSMGEEIVCCNTDHAEELYELQKQYLKEEVVPAGKNPSDLYVRSNIKSILKNQKVFAIESDGKFVSKVNTNAIGWNWVQIGGVYTDPLYRRNGYSLCLLSTLCRRIIKTGRKMCLFVKKANLPALGLYEKLGFRKSCDFQIVYFE